MSVQTAVLRPIFHHSTCGIGKLEVNVHLEIAELGNWELRNWEIGIGKFQRLESESWKLTFRLSEVGSWKSGVDI